MGGQEHCDWMNRATGQAKQEAIPNQIFKMQNHHPMTLMVRRVEPIWEWMLYYGISIHVCPVQCKISTFKKQISSLLLYVNIPAQFVPPHKIWMFIF